MMYRYRVRPGHVTRKLLIEFTGNHRNEHYLEALREVFSTSNIQLLSEETLLDETIYRATGDCGEFEISSDSYALFILAPNNERAIPFLDKSLQESGKFVREE